jgi:hypothetical protein
MRHLMFASLLCVAAVPAVHASPNCAGNLSPQPLPVRPTVISPVAPEFTPIATKLGAPSGVLSHTFDEAQSLERVLLRLRIEDCQQVAKAQPASAVPALPNPGDAAAYKPKTEFDNTPWRFDMNQNGKRMTAEEFDAWMKSRGVRVAKGAGTAAPAAAAPVVEAKE